MQDPSPPLLVTLMLAASAEAAFERERRQYFPAAINRVPAHVMLFHNLPGTELEPVTARLRDAAGRTPGFAPLVERPMLLGRGVAYRLRSAPLARLHAALAASWAGWLTAQDRQGYRPHLTIQNKVTPEAARALHARLLQGFQPYEMQATGLRLWRYLGGPWQEAGRFDFA